MAESSDRALTPDEASYVTAARDKAFSLYEGVRTPHRSCGIALAETFGLPTRPYQALRRGGITGKGACGAIRAGEQVLGELLGDPDPIGAVTPALRKAVTWYQAAWQERLVLDERKRVAGGGDPDGSAGGAGVLPRGIDERKRVAGGGDPDGSAGGAGALPRGIDEPDIICDNLVRRHGDFAGPARKAFCTNLAAEVAALTAEALCRFASFRPV